MQIINMLDNGETMTDVALHYGIGRSTIYDIKLRRTKIMANVNNISENRRTLKLGQHPELDAALYNWFLEQRAMDIVVNGDKLKEMAKEIYKRIAQRDFKASSGWLDKFKKRYGIKFNTSGTAGEKASFQSHDENVIVNFVKSFKEKVQQLGLIPDQLYCIDASSVSTKILTDAAHRMEDNEEKTINTDKITIMPCSNATGTHKFNLFVCSKESLNKDLTHLSSMCYYKQQTNAWITRDIFTEWFHDEFVPTVRSFMTMNNLPEKALLILDEAPGYPEEYHLKSNDWMINAFFLPPECSHLIQPMNHDLIQTIKSTFKKKILLNVLSKDDGVKKSLQGMNITDLLYVLAEAWNSCSPNIIRSSWKKLCPNLEISEEIDSTISIEQLLLALRDSGIDENGLRDWLIGKTEEIHDVFDDDIGDVNFTKVKPEDPLEALPLDIDVCEHGVVKSEDI
ncbi:jerky protein homolog-like [Hyposmocoma kahamanoa]|uniref:jerky protein homolog-like n=1 Tax=Hyposmocoma kahamanoa TaxID=1477025 RepID=UPI000E6D9CDD|nr:jerky protein homolog-like [Hyposmocoma kahamanoa]